LAFLAKKVLIAEWNGFTKAWVYSFISFWPPFLPPDLPSIFLSGLLFINFRSFLTDRGGANGLESEIKGIEISDDK